MRSCSSPSAHVQTGPNGNFDEARDCSVKDESANLANAIVKKLGLGSPLSSPT
jgi:hypothetical protein